MTKEMSKKFTLCSVIMAFLIVIYHLGGTFNNLNLEISSKTLRTCNKLFDYMGTLSMGYFFLVSGFLLYNQSANGEIYNKMKRRLFSLGVPFVIWNMFSAIYASITQHRLIIYSIKEMIEGLSFAPFNGPLWYIFALLLLMIPAPFFIKYNIGIILIAVASYLISTFNLYPQFLQEFSYFFWIERLMRYLPCYFTGAYIGCNFPTIVLEEKYNKKIFSIIGLLTFTAWIIIICFGTCPKPISMLMQILIPIAFWLSIDSSTLTLNMGLPFKISFFLFALHSSILIPFVSKHILPYFIPLMNKGLLIALIRLFMAIIIYVLTLIIVLIAQRLLPSKVFHILSGGRV